MRNFEATSTSRPELNGSVFEVLGDNVINGPLGNFLFFEVDACPLHNTTALIFINGNNPVEELFRVDFFPHRGNEQFLEATHPYTHLH